MSISVRQIEWQVLPMRTRMPFRYGIATVRDIQHLILRASVQVDGQEVHGLAGDHLAPRWFIKDPNLTYEQEVNLLLHAIQHASTLAEQSGDASDPFQLWWEVYHVQMEWARQQGIALLVASFSMSLIERAVVQAFCRARKVAFAHALRQNLLGIDLGRIHPVLKGTQPCDYLPAQPLESIIVRHTVGLSDPLTEAEIADNERLNDGLPQSLEACIRTYGLRYFKIKLGGEAHSDHERLRALSGVLTQHCPSPHFTLDANETYPDIDAFRAFWEQVQADTRLIGFLRNLLFVEQPLHRDEALGERTRQQLHRWQNKPPIIIDESDAELHSLPQALECGYAGCSVKSCKGIFKGIANLCLARHLTRSGTPVIISGEDLTTVPPVSLLQDLALMANLGIEHLERNGYHYFRGLTMLSEEEQLRLLNTYPDLFTRHPQGFVMLDVRDGRIRIGSVISQAFS